MGCASIAIGSASSANWAMGRASIWVPLSRLQEMSRG
jgi:hypothetical protein